MVFDAAGPEFEANYDSNAIEEPAPETQNFYDMLKSLNKSLWRGCDSHTEFSMAVSELINDGLADPNGGYEEVHIETVLESNSEGEEDEFNSENESFETSEDDEDDERD
ncbi:hypothetical protein ACFE04_011858 [Oxalis oulophora]